MSSLDVVRELRRPNGVRCAGGRRSRTGAARRPESSRSSRRRPCTAAARTGHQLGVEPPRGTAHRGPSAAATTPTSTRSAVPENDGTVTLISNWIPFEDPSGGPNFYPFSNRRLRTTSTSTTTATASPTSPTSGRSRVTYLNSNTFLYNTGVVHHLTDSTLNFRQVYTLTRIGYNAAGKQTRPRAGQERAGGTVGHRSGVDAELRDPAQVRRSRPSAPGRRSPARRTTRSSSTCGSSTCCTAATPDGKGFTEIGRRLAGALQRQHHRAEGAALAISR